MDARWPLVGRQEELALVDKAFGAPDTSGVVLAGAAGVGKTRLAKEMLAAAESQGWVTRWAVATEAAASIPFGALAPLLPIVDEAAEDRLELYRRAAADLVRGAGGGPLVLGVDDAHLLDAASAALVHQLAQRADVFVVVTIRTGAAAMPDPVVALWKDGLAERLEIPPLNRADADALVAYRLRGQVDGTTLAGLWRLTQGNPLYLRELILGGLSSGALSVVAGVWWWDGPMIAAPRLVELVEAGMGELDADERDLMEFLAFGEPLSAGLVERMVAVPVLAAAERKGLLSVQRTRQRVEVRSAHPLYSEVIRGQTSALRAREVHRRLANALEATGARRAGDLLRIVVSRSRSGGSSTPEQLVGAVREAIALDDYHLAERLARAAVNAGAGIEAQYLAGQTLIGLGRVQEAEQVLAGLLVGAPTDERRAQLASTRAFVLYWGLDRPGEATAVLQQARETITDPGGRAELDCVHAGFLVQGGSGPQALDAVAGPLDRAGTPDAEDRTVLQALLVATPALVMIGRSEAGIETARRGLDLAGRLGEQMAAPWASLRLSMDLCHAYLAAGRLDEAETLARQGYQRALGRPSPTEKVLWAGWRGQVARARGQVRTALRWLRESAAAVQRSDCFPFPFMPSVLGELAQAAALVGELPAAEMALAQADLFSAEAARRYHQQWVAAARPWVAVARGELSTAVTLALELAGQALDRGQLAAHVSALHDVARLGEPARVADALHRAVPGVQGRLAPMYADHAGALAVQDGSALDTVANAFAGIGENLLAAEAAAEAAQAHRVAGRRASALVSTRMATVLAATCQGARTPALDLLTPQPPDLTRREHEIAGLAARGLPSRAIAERLVISVRTVDNTLRQVYAKLGLTSRSELRHVLNQTDSADGFPSKAGEQAEIRVGRYS
ncbi:MAG TPA: AAA family ATPase [Pseudonocardiaceae bacterium]|nr:AAA family ATPase [Pseudonocardiaceae bacterium]